MVSSSWHLHGCGHGVDFCHVASQVYVMEIKVVTIVTVSYKSTPKIRQKIVAVNRGDSLYSLLVHQSGYTRSESAILYQTMLRYSR